MDDSDNRDYVDSLATTDYENPVLGQSDSRVGALVLHLEGHSAGFTFLGRDIPVGPGITPSMDLTYNWQRRRLQLRTRLSSGDDDVEVELTDLPSAWQSWVQHPAVWAAARVPLAMPQPVSIVSGNIPNYHDYHRFRRTGLLAAPTGTFAGASPFPPLTRRVFDRLVLHWGQRAGNGHGARSGRGSRH
jgi:hypothetical protein